MLTITKHAYGATVELSPFEAEVLNSVVQDRYGEVLEHDFYSSDPSDLQEGGENWYPGLREDQRAFFVAVRQCFKGIHDEFVRTLGEQ